MNDTNCARCQKPLLCTAGGDTFNSCGHCGHRQKPDPCPFCGGEAAEVRDHRSVVYLSMRCESCGARGPVVEGVNPCDIAKAIWEWNVRDDNGKAGVEALPAAMTMALFQEVIEAMARLEAKSGCA